MKQHTQYSKAKLARLAKVQHHLNIALAELNNIAGSSYIGSLREFKHLVSVKLKLEDIHNKITKGYDWERKRYE